MQPPPKESSQAADSGLKLDVRILLKTSSNLPSQLKMVTKILKTPSESRTSKQCTELLDLIGDLQFFKQYRENPSS